MTGNDEAVSDEKLKTDMINHLHSLAVAEKLEIRQSISKSVFWAAGLSVGAVGWLVTNADKVESNRLLMSLAGILFFGSLAALMIRQRSYFDGVASVIRKCDDFYGVFVPGRFVPQSRLYPKEWMAFSTKQWREPIFDLSAVILLFSAIVTMGAIWIVQPAAKRLAVQAAPNASTRIARGKASMPSGRPALPQIEQHKR